MKTNRAKKNSPEINQGYNEFDCNRFKSTHNQCI